MKEIKLFNFKNVANRKSTSQQANRLNLYTAKHYMSFVIVFFFFIISCSKNEEPVIEDITNNDIDMIDYETLPIREGVRPTTTSSIPHTQIDVDLVPDVHEEMVRRIYSIAGIEEKNSVVLSWQGLWIEESLTVAHPDAFIGGREFGHIHDDGSLHIFLEPHRAIDAIDAGWAVSHPFAVEGREGWDGFVMLYTPQSIEELNVTFQLIVDAYNYVSGQQVVATDFY